MSGGECSEPATKKLPASGGSHAVPLWQAGPFRLTVMENVGVQWSTTSTLETSRKGRIRTINSNRDYIFHKPTGDYPFDGLY